MSFVEARIREYLASTLSVVRPLTEVRFVKKTVGNVEIGIVARDRRVESEQHVSEHEIERQLAHEGLIRVPTGAERTRGEFKPIDVAGKPISEIIIEERR